MRITKQQATRLKELQHGLALSRDGVHHRYRHMLVLLKEAAETYNRLVRDHNSRLEEARRFVRQVGEELRDAHDEKSDRWKDSEAGQTAEDMVSEWEDAATIEDLEIVTIVEPDPPHFEESLNLPEEDQ